MFKPCFKLTLILAIFTFSPASNLAQTLPIKQVSQVPPTPPPTPIPPDPAPAGGGLGNNTQCDQNIQKPLITLRPVNQDHRLTTVQYPTFWFDIPYPSESIKFGRLILTTYDDEQKSFQFDFNIVKTPGVVSIPTSYLNHALEEGKTYFWSLQLYCQNNTSTNPDLERYGWITRVALTSEREKQIQAGMPDIWYDSLTYLAQSYINSPQDPATKTRWIQFLQSAQFGDLTQENLVGSIVPIK